MAPKTTASIKEAALSTRFETFRLMQELMVLLEIGFG